MMSRTDDLFGPTFGTEPRKIIRRNAPDTSREAGLQVDTTASERAVYALVVAAGAHGITNSEVARRLNKPIHATSGRWIALMEKGLVVDSGRRRKNPNGRNERVMVKT